MARNLRSFATPSNNFMREPIAQPDVAAAEYEIKPNLVSMVQQDQFGGSASEDAGMHLHNFFELCNMTRIKDYDPDALKLHLFPFSLRGKAKEWLLALPRGNITSWADCCSKFLSKFCPPAKIMQLHSQITSFKQEDREPLALAWDRMKEAIRNCPNHGMEEWLILHMFYNALNPMSKTMLDTAAGGTIMGKPIDDVKKLLDEMQENHAQWHVERTTTKRVNAIEEKNMELTAKLDELISIMKGKEEVNVNAITDEEANDVNFIARNSYNPNWKNNGYAPRLPYPNNSGAPNNFNGASNSNRNTLEETLKIFHC